MLSNHRINVDFNVQTDAPRAIAGTAELAAASQSSRLLDELQQAGLNETSVIEVTRIESELLRSPPPASQTEVAPSSSSPSLTPVTRSSSRIVELPIGLKDTKEDHIVLPVIGGSLMGVILLIGIVIYRRRNRRITPVTPAPPPDVPTPNALKRLSSLYDLEDGRGRPISGGSQRGKRAMTDLDIERVKVEKMYNTEAPPGKGVGSAEIHPSPRKPPPRLSSDVKRPKRTTQSGFTVPVSGSRSMPARGQVSAKLTASNRWRTVGIESRGVKQRPFPPQTRQQRE